MPPGWAKAAGWLAKPDIIAPFTEGRKLLWGWARFTPAMLAMVKDEEYRYCSIDFRFNDKDETGESVGPKIRALAMTNRPFLRDLPPIEISNEDYQQLMGMTMRHDGKLAAIYLSESGARLLNPDAVHVPSTPEEDTNAAYAVNRGQNSQDNSPGRRGNRMTKFSLKRSADGVHELHGPAGRIGEMDEQELRDYAKTHLKMRDCEGGEGGTASVQFHSLVTTTARSHNLSEEAARNTVLMSERGKQLWEQIRLDELSESAVLKHFTQDRR